MKKKIIEILNEHKYELTHDNYTREIIYEEEFEDIAESIVKLFAIPDVSNNKVSVCKHDYVAHFIEATEFKCAKCGKLI